MCIVHWLTLNCLLWITPVTLYSNFTLFKHISSYYEHIQLLCNVCALAYPGVMFFLVVSEIAATRPPFRDDDNASVATVLENYDAAKHTPVFYGNVMHKRISIDQAPEADFDASKSHPSCVGFAFVPRPPPEKASSPPPLPDVRTCKHKHHACTALQLILQLQAYCKFKFIHNYNVCKIHFKQIEH